MTWTRPPVDPAILRDCTRISRWKSIALCLGLYGTVIGLAWAGTAYPVLALLAIVVIAALQLHLLILLHEGSHLLLHPDKAVNDLAADVFCAVPLFLQVKNYRCWHLTHHKYSGQPDRDPEARIYAGQGYHYARQPGRQVVRMLLCDLLGVNALRFVRDFRRFVQEQRRLERVEGLEVRDVLLFGVIWGGAIGAAMAFGWWPQLLLFWVLPQLTLMFAFLKIHGYGEHTGATGPTEFERTWVHATYPVEEFFFAPIYSGYHLEHHLFPRVPWYLMARFRRSLPDFAEPSVTVTSYLFGRRSILRQMLWGQVDEQLDPLTPRAADPLPVPR